MNVIITFAAGILAAASCTSVVTNAGNPSGSGIDTTWRYATGIRTDDGSSTYIGAVTASIAIGDTITELVPDAPYQVQYIVTCIGQRPATTLTLDK